MSSGATRTAKLGYEAAAVRRAQPAVDLDTLVRSILFLAVFLAFWISFHPFPSLAQPVQSLLVGDPINQIGFSAILISLAAWTWFHEPRRVLLLLRPVLIALLAWFAISVATSWLPALSARRLAFTLVVMSISAMALLLPKNMRHFSELMAAAVLIVLFACYLGVLFWPQNSIHQATDFLEPQNAGSWRGVLPHKNEAGAVMNQFIFIGLFVARVRSFVLGACIVILAGIFLIFAQSKAAILLLPLVLIISAVIGKSQRPATGIALVVSVLALFNLFSVGTVVFKPVHDLITTYMPDSSFTGRTEVWQFSLDALRQHLLTGYGFSAFWGTEQVQYGMGANASWVNDTTDAHNAYLNLALTTGLPGMALAFAWIVILPILDYYRQPRGTPEDPLRMLFLRVCIYGSYASCFESSMFEQVAPWYLIMVAAFGLRYLLVSRVAA
ncbi:MAG: O-antigen ligase [Xanthobacteraceae bacterium]